MSREPATVVTFNVNEGDEVIEKKRMMVVVRCYRVYGNLPEATKTGYTFLGWFTKRDGEKRLDRRQSLKPGESHSLCSLDDRE